MADSIRDGDLVSLLRRRANEQPDRDAFVFLKDDQREHCTHADLDARAKAIAVELLKVARAGDRALILQLPGLDYVASFFGCLYAGIVAVPAYPPRFNPKLERLQSIVEDTRAAVALTSGAVREGLSGNLTDYPVLSALHWVATDQLSAAPAGWAPAPAGPETLAFLQYTSGSVAAPKGVMVSHGNLMANLRAIQVGGNHSPESRGIIWLPPYHDMGLIGGILQPLFGGFPAYLMSPYAFLQRPVRWLQAISDLRGTTTAAPNFAFELCLKRVSDEQLAKLDLSSLEVAFCGAEPIRPDVIDRFCERFAPAGFRREALYPCYGLAEATLMVSGTDQSTGPVARAFSAAGLEKNAVREAQAGQADARMVMGCGIAPDNHQIAIVDPERLCRVEPGCVGEIWVNGPSVAQGYWERAEATETTFRARIVKETGEWLRTGDLGFLDQGQLFITGRIKDLMIFRGRNIYPQDIEAAAQSAHPAVAGASGAAFSVDQGDEERLILVQEVDRAEARKADLAQVTEAVQARVFAAHDIRAHEVLLIRAHSLPKTSSGKVQRQATRQKYLEGALTEVRAAETPS